MAKMTEKGAYLLETKRLIAQAIVDKGQPIEANTLPTTLFGNL